MDGSSGAAWMDPDAVRLADGTWRLQAGAGTFLALLIGADADALVDWEDCWCTVFGGIDFPFVVIKPDPPPPGAAAHAMAIPETVTVLPRYGPAGRRAPGTDDPESAFAPSFSEGTFVVPETLIFRIRMPRTVGSAVPT